LARVANDEEPQSHRLSTTPPPSSVRGPRSTAAPPAAGLSRARALFHLGSARPIALQILGRTLLHAALVGAVAGVVGTVFFWALEVAQRWILELPTGYVPLRAEGERVAEAAVATPFRPWLLWVVPALGALGGGIVSHVLAPETCGGGSDAIIRAYHHEGGRVRRRVAFVKALASILTLGSGGSGGREGPTMQIGGAIGSNIGRLLDVTERERRILLVAGTAAGMAAVFRTPLGAALLAVEILHRDDFETDALVPSVLASVVSYSVFISFFGEATLFAHAPRYPFVPAHLPLYAAMALFVSLVASGFVWLMDLVKDLAARAKLPAWSKPAVGGLATGLLATLNLVLLGPFLGRTGHGLGILGGGYGAAQIAITGAPWFGEGWRAVQILLLLGGLKVFATAFTVGSGGSAGDFGPSLVMGGLFGGAFGRVAQLSLHDPRIDPGAFALVGMGVFYGGLAHVPIASLVMVCELAGSYDLLVPLMLAGGIAFVALRHRSLYKAQVPTKRDSPAHRDDLIFDVLRDVRVADVMTKDRPFESFEPRTRGDEVVRRVAESEWQDSFPVLAADGKLLGVITAEILRTTAAEPGVGDFALAADMMSPPFAVKPSDDLRRALEVIMEHGVREIIVVDDGGRIVGFLDEADITRVYHEATRARQTGPGAPS
jgi:CIC family chloride channel protein